jgi:hypothetical protein
VSDLPKKPPEQKTITGEIDIVKSISASMRRVTAADERPDPDGLVTLWHQGSHKTELLTWIRRQPGGEPEIVRQQISFLSHVVDWRAGKLRTGQAKRDDEDTGVGAARAQLVGYDREPVARTLELIGILMRFVRQPDRYTEHMRVLVDPKGAPAENPVVDTSGPLDALAPEAEAEPEKRGGLSGLLDRLRRK